MPRDLPGKPKHTWRKVLVVIYDKFGTDEFRTRDLVKLFNIKLSDASMRIQRLRRWRLVKELGRVNHGAMVNALTRKGMKVAEHIKKEGV